MPQDSRQAVLVYPFSRRSSLYTLLSAIALPNTIGAQWSTVNLNTVSVSEIFSKYKEIVLTLKRDSEEVFVDLNQLRSKYATYTNTLPVLLQVLANYTFETLSTLPNKKIDYIKYSDVTRVGYRIKLARRGVVLPEHYPTSELVDIELTRPQYKTDLSLLHTHCLVSVNGYYHMTDTDGERTYIVDGGITSRYQDLAQVGLTSFLSIGQLEKIKLQETDLSTRPGSDTLKDTVVITVDKDTTNKSFFLVLGGYLVMPQEGIFWQVGEYEYHLDLKRLPYLERLLESHHYIDLQSLALTYSELNKENLNIEEIWSDRVIKKYFTLSQSFFVIVDRDNLFTNKITLRQMMSPGIFTTYQDPSYPLIVGTGKTAEYWKVHEDGHWAVTVLDNYYRNYIFNRQNQNTLVNVTGQLSFDRPFFYSQGFLLEIGAYASE